MRTLLTGALLAALALPLCALDALAHGGQYRGPGGAIPPEQREPHDPQPPPPPPPSTGAPPVTGSPQPTPGKVGDPTPVTPGGGSPVSPGATPLTGGTRPTGGRATVTADSWIFWYENNKAALEDLKHQIYSFTGSNPFSFGSEGGAGFNARSGARHMTRALVKAEVVPALLRAMDPANFKHQDIESAAFIALAKTTDDPVHVELLQKGLTSKNLVTRESAMLALGLLRRERTADQFDAPTLDRTRDFLFDVFADTKQPSRTRAFAAFAIGLLGDQPSGGESHSGAATTTERLFSALRIKHAHPDLAVALLMALSLQPATSFHDEQLKVLRTAVTKGRLYNQEVQDFTASYAALALGRIGNPKQDTLTLLRVIGGRSLGVNVERSSVISLGKLGMRAAPEDRVMIARALKDGVVRKRIRDRTARNLALISLAYLVQADVEANRADVISEARVGTYLLGQAEDGRYGVREYAALALGLICKSIGDTPSTDVYGEYQSNARHALRGGLASKKIDPRGRGAYAVALGIAGDELSIPRLVEVLADTRTDDDLRGYAAVALGHIGVPSRSVLQTIRTALTSRRSEKLRRSTATALGMLHDRQAVTLLVEELKRARSQTAKGQVVIALARVGDERALKPLIELLQSEREKDLTRALACAGLGMVGDVAWIPSLSRISRDINYRASGDAINEVLSIL